MKQDESTLTIVQGDNGKYGVRNQWGVMKQPCVYDRIERDGEGVLWTYKDELMGCVDDYDGDIMVSCRWKEVEEMEEFYFKVKDDSGKWGVVSDADEQELSCEWDDIKTDCPLQIQDTERGARFIDTENNGIKMLKNCP